MIRAGDIPIQSPEEYRRERSIDGMLDWYRLAAEERADRLDDFTPAQAMSWPTAEIDVERVRPAVKDDADGTAAARGVLFGLMLGVVFWLPAVLVGVPIVKDAVA